MAEAWVIAGPTAAGKSCAALQLARAGGGEIVNADAMQVYRDLSVLTARPGLDDEEVVPHHLYGVSAGDDVWSAGRFARAAGQLVDDILARGQIPFIVGGTGLWLSALVQGLSPIPEIPEEVSRAAAGELARLGPAAFRAEVVGQDPAMARLNPADRQRHLRAWSVFTATGRPLSRWQEMPPVRVTDAPFRVLILSPPRAALHAAAAWRFDAMLGAGALDEVRALLSKGYAPSVPVMKAVGVPELTRHLSGETALSEARETAIVATRQLIKRQGTWFRNRFAGWPTVAAPDAVIPQRFGRP